MKNMFIGMLIVICLGAAIYGISLNKDLKTKQNEIVVENNYNNSNQENVENVENIESNEYKQNTLVDNEFVKIIINSNMESEKGVYTNLYIENKTKENVTISIDKISVNNKNVSTRFEDNLSPNEKKVSDIRWNVNDVKNIKDLRVVKGTLNIKGYKKIFSGEVTF